LETDLNFFAIQLKTSKMLPSTNYKSFVDITCLCLVDQVKTQLTSFCCETSENI